MSESGYPGETPGPIVQRGDVSDNVVQAAYYVTKGGAVRHTPGPVGTHTLCGLEIPLGSALRLTALPDCQNCKRSE